MYVSRYRCSCLSCIQQRAPTSKLNISIMKNLRVLKNGNFLFSPPPPLSGEKILQQARQQVESAGISPSTGLHDPEVAEPPPLTPSALAKSATITEDMLENGITSHHHCYLALCRNTHTRNAISPPHQKCYQSSTAEMHHTTNAISPPQQKSSTAEMLHPEML